MHRQYQWVDLIDFYVEAVMLQKKEAEWAHKPEMFGTFKIVCEEMLV